MVFTTLERLFEPTLMFFGLMNSPATFQTMMNKILWNLINTGKVVSFIDDVIIGLECDKVSTTVGELPPTTVLSYIDSSGSIDIHAKTC